MVPENFSVIGHSLWQATVAKLTETSHQRMRFEPAFASGRYELPFGMRGRVASSKETDHVEELKGRKSFPT
jgi:hypothetical protein